MEAAAENSKSKQIDLFTLKRNKQVNANSFTNLLKTLITVGGKI